MKENNQKRNTLIISIALLLILLLSLCFAGLMSTYNDSVDPEDYDTDPPAINEEDINDDPTPTVSPTSTGEVVPTPTVEVIDTYENTRFDYKLSYSKNTWGIQSGEADCGDCPIEGDEFTIVIDLIDLQTYPIGQFRIESYTLIEGKTVEEYIHQRDPFLRANNSTETTIMNGDVKIYKFEFIDSTYSNTLGNLVATNYYFQTQDGKSLIAIITRDTSSKIYRNSIEEIINSIEYIN